MPFYEDMLLALLALIKYCAKSKKPLRAEHKRVSLLDLFAGLQEGKKEGRKVAAPTENVSAQRGGIVVLRGSMTIEAALVLPLYIFFFCNVLYIMEAVRFQSSMSAALHETGMRMCEYAYYTEAGAGLLENGEEEEDPGGSGGSFLPSQEDGFGGVVVSAVLSEGYVRASCREFLGETYLENGPVQGGASGITYLRSAIPDEEDCIRLVADYRIRAFVPVLAPAAYSLSSHFYAHPFTGFDAGGEEEESETEEEMVYIAATSTSVYHRSRNCSYLVPGKRSVSAGEVDALRNNQGGKYYQCEFCRPAKTGILVITAAGTRYHEDDSCSAIYRDVMEVPLREVEDTRHACVRCGGG